MVSVTCTKCGTINGLENVFCSECGEKIAQKGSTPFEKSIQNNGNLTSYILQRSNLANVSATFLAKNDKRLLYNIKSSNNLKIFLKSMLISALIFPLIILMLGLYTILPFKGLIFLMLEILVVPTIILLFLFLSSAGRSIKYSVLSENNDEIGIMKVNSKYFDLKSTLLGKNWKFTATNNTMELYVNFSTRYEGTLTANQISYNISIRQDKKDKRFYRGLSKIEAYNEQDKSIISLVMPEKTSRRRMPPAVLEVSASDSINELVVVFFVVVVVAKYLILAR